jgi:hypothetical protein
MRALFEAKTVRTGSVPLWSAKPRRSKTTSNRSPVGLRHRICRIMALGFARSTSSSPQPWLFTAWRRRPEENRKGARGARERGEMFHVRFPLLVALFAHESPVPCVPCALAVLSASVLPAPFGSSVLARTGTPRRLELASRFFRIGCLTRERLQRVNLGQVQVSPAGGVGWGPGPGIYGIVAHGCVLVSTKLHQGTPGCLSARGARLSRAL